MHFLLYSKTNTVFYPLKLRHWNSTMLVFNNLSHRNRSFVTLFYFFRKHSSYSELSSFPIFVSFRFSVYLWFCLVSVLNKYSLLWLFVGFEPWVESSLICWLTVNLFCQVAALVCRIRRWATPHCLIVVVNRAGWKRFCNLNKEVEVADCRSRRVYVVG